MKLCWPATLVLIGCIWLQGSATAQQTDEAAVIAVTQAVASAFRDGNIPALEELLAPDIIIVDPGAGLSTRDTALQAIRSGVLRYEVFLSRDATARLYGDTAIVIGITAVKGIVKGKSADQPFALDIRSTDVLVRDKGKWRLVSKHGTRMPDQ